VPGIILRRRTRSLRIAHGVAWIGVHELAIAHFIQLRPFFRRRCSFTSMVLRANRTRLEHGRHIVPARKALRPNSSICTTPPATNVNRELNGLFASLDVHLIGRRAAQQKGCEHCRALRSGLYLGRLRAPLRRESSAVPRQNSAGTSGPPCNNVCVTR